MPLAPAAAPPDHELDRKRSEPAAKESPVQDTSPHPLNGVLSALGADNSDDSNSRLVSNPLLQRRANAEMRTLIMRRLQQGAGNHKTQQLIAQLRRSSVIQRECACGGTCSTCQEKGVEEEEESQPVQRQPSAAGAAGGTVDAGVIPTDSPGQPLDRSTREFMEPRFGSDFSDVRVHTDSRAATSADTLAADAYTTGSDIYFAAGKYAPASQEGQHLLAHELTHTVQQAEGRIPQGGFAAQAANDVAIGDPDDPLEREADESAVKVVDPKASTPGSPTPAASPKEIEGGARATSGPKADVSTPEVAKAVGPTKTIPQRPGTNAAPSSAALPAPEPAAKKPPSPVARRKSVTSPPAASRLPLMPTVQTPAIPFAEPAVDLAAPFSSMSDAMYLQTPGHDPEITLAELENKLEQLQAIAETRKTKVLADTARVKAGIVESGSAQVVAIRASVAEGLVAVQTQIASLRAGIAAEATKVKAAAAVTTVAGQLNVLVETAAQNKAIEASAQAHKKQATAAVMAEREAVRKFGEDEGRRGKDAMEKQAQQAVAMGQSKAAGYPADERGQVQGEAVLKTAAEVATKLREPGPDLQSSLTDGGKELASGIADVDEDLAKSIDEQTPKITQQLLVQAGTLGPQFETIRDDVSKGVDDFLVDLNGKLDEVERTASSELMAMQVFIVAQIEASVTQIQARLDFETEALVSSIDRQFVATSQAAKRIRRPRVNGVRSALEKAEAEIDRLAGLFTDGLDDVASTARTGFADAGSKVVNDIATLTANVSGALAGLRTPAQEGLATLGTKAKEGCDKITEEWKKSLVGTQKAVDEKYDEAVAGMVKEIEKDLAGGKAKLSTQVNEAVAKNREPLDQLESKMEDAAKEARDKYDAPWYKKVGSWLLHALTGFLKALWGLLKIVLVVVVAIVAIIVGIVFDVVALIVIGVILLVGVVVYVLYQIVKGIIARVESANTWWQGIWGAVVGVLDITGVPGMIEGLIQHDIVNGKKLTVEEAGDRFGAGLFALLTIILPAKMKGARVPGEVPRLPADVPIDPSVVPLDPAPPVAPVDPAARPGVPVDPTRPAVPVDPVNPAVPAEPVRPATPSEPAPVEPPKPAAPVEPPKPAAPVEPPKPATPVEPPKPAAPVEPPKPAAPVEPQKPASPEAPKVPEEAPKTTEPTTPEEVQKAKLEEAEAAEAGKRPKVRDLADLNRLKEKAPLKDKPPAGVEPGSRLWSDYVDYWNDRVKLLENELKKNPNVEPKTRPPLDWKTYSEFRGKFIRGIDFQDDVTDALQKENPNLRIEDNVGVRKPGDPGATTKFADQLGADKAKLEGWKKGDPPPEVKTWSDKSRDFRDMPAEDVNARVLEDINEARTKYGGEIEIRRPGHPLYGQVVKVTDVTLVYDAKLVPAEVRPGILKSAEGTGVHIEFRQK